MHIITIIFIDLIRAWDSINLCNYLLNRHLWAMPICLWKTIVRRRYYAGLLGLLAISDLNLSTNAALWMRTYRFCMNSKSLKCRISSRKDVFRGLNNSQSYLRPNCFFWQSSCWELWKQLHQIVQSISKDVSMLKRLKNQKMPIHIRITFIFCHCSIAKQRYLLTFFQFPGSY